MKIGRDQGKHIRAIGVQKRQRDRATLIAAKLCRPILSRLARTLAHLAERDSDYLVHAGHDHLAALVGTYRETITTNLRRLQRDGYVELGRRSIHVLDIDGLGRLGGGSPPRFPS